MATKTVTPPVFSTRTTGKSQEEENPVADKRTTITHKSAPKPAEGLAQVLAETERTIQELTRMFAETASSKHIGAGGKLKLTPQQEAIQKQLTDAQTRHERILKILESQ